MSRSKPGTYVDYPLFVTTQESNIGLFATACSDCKAAKKFARTDAVGYAAGKEQAVTEWVNVYDPSEAEL